MTDREPFAVLFLCTGNSARSIMAESILNRLGRGRFKGYSAGSMPTGKVNPNAIKLLHSLGYSIESLHSKSWDEFATEDAPALDFIVTVCDNAAGEVCPIWPGRPVRAHWGVPDPAATTGYEAEIAVAFAEAYRMLKSRIELFVGLPLDKLGALSLKHRMDEIGTHADAPQATA
jgi:arsenate reductase